MPIDAPLAERWDGASWTLQATPYPVGAEQGRLTAVSCTSDTSCLAVGWYQDSGGDVDTLAEDWDGTSWSMQSTPDPPGGSQPMLTSVSCGSPTTCTAVGAYSNAGNQAILVEQWNGTSWAIEATPTLTGATASELGACHVYRQ